MAQVTLRINGYAYTLGCQDGEERHLEAMGEEVGRRIDGVRAAAGPSGEARMLVMAPILWIGRRTRKRNRGRCPLASPFKLADESHIPRSASVFRLAVRR